MMDGANAPRAARCVARFTHVDAAPGILEPIACPPVFGAEILEAKHRCEELRRGGLVPLPEAAVMKPADLSLGFDRALFPWRKRTIRRGRFNKRQTQPVWIRERQRALAKTHLDRLYASAVLFQSSAPIRKAVSRHFEPTFPGKPVSHTRRGHLRPRKKREIRPGPPFGVCVEQVVRTGVILVDTLLDESHAQDAGVEVEIFLRRAGNRRDVVQSVD